MGHAFCRGLKKQMTLEISKVTTPAERKKAYAYKSSAGYEYHAPDGEYYYLGSKPDCLTSAKAYGMIDWLKHKHPDLGEVEDSTISDSTVQRFKELACQLSPENLSCDGEIPPYLVRGRRNRIMKEWQVLESSIGQKVTEDQVWSW